MTYEARNRKTVRIYGREANKFRYFHNFQTKAAPTFANGSKKLFSHIEFAIQISSKSTTSIIFSFLVSLGDIDPKKFLKISKTSHGQNSRDIRSQNILVILYLGDPYFSSMGLEILRQ